MAGMGDWVAALLPPLVTTIAGGMLTAAMPRASYRVSSSTTPDREVANVAAMATRDYYTATQDKNPLMALVHVTSAASLLTAARRMSTDEHLSIALSTDVRGIASDIEELQRSITARLARRRAPARTPPGALPQS